MEREIEVETLGEFKVSYHVIRIYCGFYGRLNSAGATFKTVGWYWEGFC